MTALREPGQTVASAVALGEMLRATSKVSEARWTVTHLQNRIREARKVLRAAEAAEKAAEATYLATPYADV